jgi:HAD superfamily hydrolase (TIGR01509 family)
LDRGKTAPIVLFDIGGVLIRFDDRATFRRVARLLRLDLETTAAILRDLREGLQSGRLTLHQFWTQFARAADRRLPDEWRSLWLTELIRTARPNRPVLKVASDLRRRGVRTGVFSNTDASHWRWFRSRGWLDGFSPRIASFRIGAVKPHATAYRRAERRYLHGWGPLVFVDDNDANLRTARQCGWDSVPFVSAARLRTELRRRGLLD